MAARDRPPGRLDPASWQLPPHALHSRLRAQSPGWAGGHGGPGGGDLELELALASLRERDREALMLVAWDGLDHRTAAIVMGCTTGSLTVRLHRARRRLAKALADSGTEPIEFCEEASPSQ